ncbi:ABC transporter permease subunit [Desulfosarcina sp. OttesenSCG-928-B08]|nr:ABC transporter permease subunit [Desulfosarcina sp. OttesenSCG-928-B08]
MSAFFRVKRPLGVFLLREGGRVAVLLVLFCVAALILFIMVKGAPTLGPKLLFGQTPPLEAVLGMRPVWDGLWPALAGTLCLVALTIGLSLFPGIGCGIFLAEYAGPRWKKIAGSAVDVLAGTPSIVMGLFGFTLILFLRRTFFPNANTCLLIAACCLSLLVLPVLIVSTREALSAIPENMRLTAASLGLGKSAQVRHVLLPAAAPGIWSGIVLAVGRSAEDTAVIMLTGVVANAGLPAGIAAKFEALPFAVYYSAAQYQTQNELRAGFGAALLLLLLAGGMVLAARVMEAGYRRRWTGGRG